MVAVPGEMLSTQQIASLKALAARFGVSHLRAFGSYARGEAGPQSDLDLLVSIEYGPDVASRLVDFVLAAEQLLPMRIDVVTERSLDPRVHGPILTEARAL